jgi:hypothetical protein
MLLPGFFDPLRPSLFYLKILFEISTKERKKQGKSIFGIWIIIVADDRLSSHNQTF